METHTAELLKGILEQFEFIEQRFDILEKLFKQKMEILEVLVLSVKKRLDETIDGVYIEYDDLN